MESSRAWCKLRCEAKKVLGLQRRGVGALIEPAIRSYASALLRRCSKEDVRALAAGDMMPPWATPEAIAALWNNPSEWSPLIDEDKGREELVAAQNRAGRRRPPANYGSQ